MKLIYTIIFITMLNFITFAQNEKIIELGLASTSLASSYGLSYKTGTLKKVWSFRALSANGSINQTLVSEGLNQNRSFSNSLFFAVDREKRLSINDKIEFRKGFGVFADYDNSKSDSQIFTADSIINYETTNKTNRYALGISYLIGGNLLLKNNFILGISISPQIRNTISIRRIKGKNYNQFGGIDSITDVKTVEGYFSYGISLSSVLFTIAYRFTKN